MVECDECRDYLDANKIDMESIQRLRFLVRYWAEVDALDAARMHDQQWHDECSVSYVRMLRVD